MECRSARGGESAQHQMAVAHRAHGGTGLGFSFIVLAVTPIATMPGVGTLHPPAVRERREPVGPVRTCRHGHGPLWTMVFHPGLERMMVRWMIATDRFAPGTVVRSALLEQYRGRHAISSPRTRAQDSKPQAQGSDQQRPLAPVDVLAAIVAALGTAHLRRRDGVAVATRGAWRGFPTCWPASLFSPCPEKLGPRALGAPPRKRVVCCARGQHLVREHIPLTTAPIQL
jgi:hypothetical protein